MRTWDAFNGLEVTVKNMLTSLRAVGELQNPAIRDRHWQQLVTATRVQFMMSEETSLADLLNLNLHNFEDEVHNIVDKAIKEMAMERMLKELEVIWSSMEFQHETHARTGYTLLRTSEELIETLEENQVQLQNMMTSKYIGFFLEEISTWQKRLSVVDTVISLWFDVQRTWSHLESIFIGSEDIRKQLPVDSQRFDEIDTEFKGLMVILSKTANVVKVSLTLHAGSLITMARQPSSFDEFLSGYKCKRFGRAVGGDSIPAVPVREGLGRVPGDEAVGLPQVLFCILQ